MNGKCKYPGCTIVAKGTFALVPLCDSHNAAIRIETNRYYLERIGRNERVQYKTIEHLTPWGQSR